MKILIQKYTYTFAFLFVITKIWKQPKFLLIDKWIKKMWQIYTKKYYSYKYEILSFKTTWIDLECIRLSEVILRKTNAICFHLHIESKKQTNEQT